MYINNSIEQKMLGCTVVDVHAHEHAHDVSRGRTGSTK